MPRKKDGQRAKRSGMLAHASCALTDATDDAAVVEDLLALMHLAGISLEPATSGAVSSGAMVTRQHMASLRDNLNSARRKIEQLRLAYQSEGRIK